MYKIKTYNANSFKIGLYPYSKSYQMIQASPGCVSIVSIYDENYFILKNEPVSNITIEDISYPNEAELILAFEPFKKSDGSGGTTTADVVTAIENLEQTIIQNDSELKQAIIAEGNETQEAILGQLQTKDYDVAETFEGGASKGYQVPMTVTAGQLYDVAVAGVPTGIDYIHEILTGFVKIIFTNNGATTVPFNQTITLSVKKQ
jgi:hypothetical protein